MGAICQPGGLEVSGGDRAGDRGTAPDAFQRVGELGLGVAQAREDAKGVPTPRAEVEIIGTARSAERAGGLLAGVFLRRAGESQRRHALVAARLHSVIESRRPAVAGVDGSGPAGNLAGRSGTELRRLQRPGMIGRRIR